MFPLNFESCVDSLITKLCNFSRADVIDLLEIVQCLNQSDKTKSSIDLHLSQFERHLLKGALPHCIEVAVIRPNIIIPASDIDQPQTTSAISVPATSPPQTKTPLTSFSVQGDIVGVPEAILSGVGHDCDISKPATLIVTKRFLRQVLMKLPRWVFWNQWNDEQKQEIKESLKVKRPIKNRHELCKWDKSKVPNASCLGHTYPYDLNGDPDNDPDCTFIPNVRPYVPLYIMKRPGLNRDDPLSLLRYYCKHFHAGQWIQDYQKLVDGLRECTFQPNIHKYLSRIMTRVEIPKNPFAAGDPFAALKEKFEDEREKKRDDHELGMPPSPKYRGPFSRRHYDCTIKGTTRIPYTHRKDQCYGLLEGARQRRAFEKSRYTPWEKTLRNDIDWSKTVNHSLRKSNPKNIRKTDSSKQKRYESDDWGKYIRLSDRHLVPICIPDVIRLESIIRDNAPPWDNVEHPKPIVIERSSGHSPNDKVALLIQPSVEDFRVNQKRNLYSVIRHGVDNGELVAPLVVIGVPRDPISDLEDKLEETVPQSLTDIFRERQLENERR